jgi:uncharacterized RDD family membrane protein YckC
MRTALLRVRTPEGIVFSLPLAGPVARFLAWLVDLACISAIGSLVSTALGWMGLLSLDIAAAFITLAYFAIAIGYGIVMEWLWRGQTIGKRLLKLRVLDEQGLRLTFSQIVVRNLLRFVDALPAFYLVGGAAMLVSRRAQRLGDYAANTVVVRTPAVEEPDLDQILAGKYNSLRGHPVLAARLRQRITPEEAALALQSLLRRDRLEPQARVELFRDIALHFRALVEFPPEATEGIADEQYIRNVVDIVFRVADGRPSGA